MNSVTQERDQRVAIHEAAHVVAGFLLGERPGPVTIVETPAYGGRACHHALPYPKSDLERMFGWPLPLIPARLRRSIEVRVMVLLAGSLAVDAYWPTSAYVAPSLDEEAAAEFVERVTSPTLEDRVVLESDADVPYTEDKSDDARAFNLAHALVDDLVAAYLNLLRAATVQLISTPEFSEGMDAIIPALLQHKTLSTRTVRMLLNGKEKQMAATRTKIDLEKLYRCIEPFSFTTDEGVPVTLNTETVLLGRHEYVHKFPHFFGIEGDPAAQARTRGPRRSGRGRPGRPPRAPVRCRDPRDEDDEDEGEASRETRRRRRASQGS